MSLTHRPTRSLSFFSCLDKSSLGSATECVEAFLSTSSSCFADSTEILIKQFHLFLNIFHRYDMLYASLKNLSYIETVADPIKFRLIIWNDNHLFGKFIKISLPSEKLKDFKADEEELNQYLVSEERMDNPADITDNSTLEATVKDCVRHHEMILEFTKYLEEYFNGFIISKFLFSSWFLRPIIDYSVLILFLPQLFLFVFLLMLYLPWRNFRWSGWEIYWSTLLWQLLSWFYSATFLRSWYIT